jgi:hypothetical protein
MVAGVAVWQQRTKRVGIEKSRDCKTCHACLRKERTFFDLFENQAFQGNKSNEQQQVQTIFKGE